MLTIKNYYKKLETKMKKKTFSIYNFKFILLDTRKARISTIGLMNTGLNLILA